MGSVERESSRSDRRPIAPERYRVVDAGADRRPIVLGGVRNRDLRTRAGQKKERAENYVECVRSVAGGVYFVMQINARLPKHPSPTLARPPATPYPRSYPCFPSRRRARACVRVYVWHSGDVFRGIYV